VLYDCDPGHDDAIALVMAHRSPDIELIGVTTVCGNAELARTTANAIRVLDLVGADAVPIAAGCVSPLTRELVLGTADGPSGLEGTPYLPPPSRTVDPRHGVDYLANELRAASEPLVVVATGPLTNIAMLLLKYPELTRKIERIVSMGGAFFRRDEYITPTEFNIFCDPEAAQIVFDSAIPVFMVGLDVTMKVLVEQAQFRELAKIDTSLGRVVIDWLEFYEKLHRGQMGVGGALHDPLAMAVLIDPDLVEFRSARVDIDLTATHVFGATVADYWQQSDEDDNVMVATSVNADRFFELLYALLRDTDTPPAGTAREESR